MAYQYIPNTNSDLMVIEAGTVITDDGEVFEPVCYPIIGWQLEVDERSGATLEPLPVAIGWDCPVISELGNDRWGVLDRRQGIVLNDFGMWRSPVEGWKEAREREFLRDQAGQD